MIQAVTAIPVQPVQVNNNITAVGQSTPAEVTQSFGNFLEQALNSVSAQEQNAQVQATQFMAGKVDVSQVMIASEQAQLSLQLTTQIRNRVVEAYQDIMRMQL
ncbi:flagellar hook-basal body complex subunit FliE [Paenibacillus curdlanolyticus YK9]|uniref:Flagellar hook-basal body complex protein FliE n=1 Tax=Paenibacillus curdlanolyticus YK9 TaxID=717606 RepID=E0I439_9BACL|nr:flagellar hook-basal body complex protein FliE [Paenibacillus curdlanolyticus]EFM13053.1 flagellar hook-basal body complex subunit FliE [Paenibacillus curdlanolyticus YK9]